MTQRILLAKENNNIDLPLIKRCKLLNVNRSAIYYHPVELSQENINLMNLIHGIWFKHHFYGYRKLTVILQNHGYCINHKKVFM